LCIIILYANFLHYPFFKKLKILSFFNFLNILKSYEKFEFF
jgi:hypothetical protein